MYQTIDKQHPLFDKTKGETFISIYLKIRQQMSNETIIIAVDHEVDDDFFWHLNSEIIRLSTSKTMGSLSEKPIIPLPLNSTDAEFTRLYSKVNGGTIIIDNKSFNLLNFRSKNPFYFYSNRIVIHRTGDISAYSARRF